jgi:hypothetical protein
MEWEIARDRSEREASPCIEESELSEPLFLGSDLGLSRNADCIGSRFKEDEAAPGIPESVGREPARAFAENGSRGLASS